MEKETKEKLREAGWTVEEIIDLEMEEKKVTISEERYKELLKKEELLEVNVEYDKRKREEE